MDDKLKEQKRIVLLLDVYRTLLQCEDALRDEAGTLVSVGLATNFVAKELEKALTLYHGITQEVANAN